jgi:hypothetical protein
VIDSMLRSLTENDDEGYQGSLSGLGRDLSGSLGPMRFPAAATCTMPAANLEQASVLPRPLIQEIAALRLSQEPMGSLLRWG